MINKLSILLLWLELVSKGWKVSSQAAMAAYAAKYITSNQQPQTTPNSACLSDPTGPDCKWPDFTNGNSIAQDHANGFFHV
jgi:hypothetical protein